jgi:hypothetical protein
MRNHTKEVKSLRLIGVGLKDLVVYILCLRQFPRRMMFNAKIQCLLQCQRLL